MGVLFARERFADAWAGIEPLIATHWREVAYPGDTPPAPDVDGYIRADNEGRLETFTARDGGSLVGYATFWVGPFPQRKGMIGAWQDAVYLAPSSRHPPLRWWQRLFRRPVADVRRPPGIGVSFLRFCDEQLADAGCHVVHHSVRAGRDFSPVLRRLGYVQAEILYAKHLGA